MVFEPRYSRSAGSRPDPQLLVFNKGIFLKSHSLLIEQFHFSLNVRHFPTKHSVLRRYKAGSFSDAYYVFTCLHYESELVVAHKLQAQLAFIKGPGAIG